ncbi:hypothetical protein B0T22DRAFT_42496 [Podospora appendiculata]|uniref:Oxidoreductase n=1 Tax=Podospora appendiculata TaxID=314037 RepID=A0AAE1CGK2_9PEZI|nr:hypothetical protein B0T22DRAFT_42496 [Podospora appendiculata]
MAEHVWFITACSSGFGRAIAFSALRRGHKVIATARDSSKLGELRDAGAVVMDVDVTSDDETLTAKLAEANAVFGKITHVVNCAGYILEGTIEEASNKEVFDQFNTNVFGTFNIARAATQYLRSAAAGEGGRRTALATFGSLGSWQSSAAVAHCMLCYASLINKHLTNLPLPLTDCSTKFAVSGLTEGLADELKAFGIDVCVVEPGYTRTGFLARGSGSGSDNHRIQTAKRLAVYDGTPAAALRDAMEVYDGKQPGSVEKSAELIVDVLTGEGVAAGRPVPVRLVLGEDAVEAVRRKCKETLELLEAWEAVGRANTG